MTERHRAPRRNPTYYRGDLRRALLDAALRVVATDGPAGVNLRALARRLGVSHAAPAIYFPDKPALFTALAREAFGLLGRALDDAVAAQPAEASAARRFQAIGAAYARFALEHRAHFEVMWRNDLLRADDPELTAAADATFTQLLDGVAAAQREGWARGADPRTAAYLAWSTVHGLAVLWIHGPLRHGESRAFDEVAEAVSTLLHQALSRPVPTTQHPEKENTDEPAHVPGPAVRPAAGG